jgi:hypothetical protein
MPPNPTEHGPGGFFDTAKRGKKDKKGRKKRNSKKFGKPKPKDKTEKTLTYCGVRIFCGELRP